MITAVEASEILGLSRVHTNAILRNTQGIHYVKVGQLNYYHRHEIEEFKSKRDAELASRPTCKHCDNQYADGYKDSYGFCRKKTCQVARQEWLKTNWDLMPENNKFRRRYEAEFWEVTPEQRERYASFFSLVREPKPLRIRRCLRCKCTLQSNRATSPNHRMCEACHDVNANVGALAYD